MLIQNASNAAQTAQSARFASDGAPIVVANTLNAEALPGVAIEQVASQQTSSEQLQNAVEGINLTMRQLNQNLEFSVDTGTNKTIVKMVDTQTGELIRQFPTEETLAIARSIDQFLQRQRLLLSQKA